MWVFIQHRGRSAAGPSLVGSPTSGTLGTPGPVTVKIRNYRPRLIWTLWNSV